MNSGFIFNNNLCVACKSCSAACVLENGWLSRPREIYTVNSEAISFLPLMNISLSCNHCERAVCMEGCPSGAFVRDTVTGAVIMDANKCMGCNYCRWNCPYDAPKPASSGGIIEKCDLCHARLSEGLDPACSSACPTGALSFGNIKDTCPAVQPEWFPEKNLKPSIIMSGNIRIKQLKIIPEIRDRKQIRRRSEKSKSLSGEWSLMIFTYLIAVSVAIVCSSIVKGIFSSFSLLLATILISAFTSVLHLRRKHSAWRAVSNLKRSHLSREIAVFLLFSVISIVSFLSGSPGLLLLSAITGLILLFAIDSVYVFADNSFRTKFHPGQAFLTGLILTSLLSGTVIPFVFLACIKLILTMLNIFKEKRTSSVFVIKFFRIAILLIATAGYASGLYSSAFIIYLMVFAGELADRILFYFDYSPLNIETQITKYLNNIENEKEAG